VRPVRVRFADCVFDASIRELRRKGSPVHLPPKAFALLELLLERRPRPVPRAEIADRLWPDTAVGASSLARVVVDVRCAIGDDARHPRLLRTVHGFGYSFSDEAVSEGPGGAFPSDALVCRLAWGDREFPLGEGEHVLGRLPDARVWIDSASVSRRHARIVVSAGRATIEDLGSKNGTWLRGERLTGPVELADGDAVTVGPAVLRFRASRAATTTDTDVRD
jgi:DNA-binding winged helix-turn-helix (wHTH) protein